MATQTGESVLAPRPRGGRQFWSKNRRPLSALVVFVAMLVIFTFANPRVFLNPALYGAVFISLPITMILCVPLVFMVAIGEIDLSFPSVVGLGAWAFAWSVQSGYSPWAGLWFALFVGALAGVLNGLLVTKVGLSSLVSTIGMQFFLRGLIQIGNQGLGIPLTSLAESSFYYWLVGRFFGIPMQMIWGLLFALLGWVLFTRHVFGARVCCIGDNPQSAKEMGINVDRYKIYAFVYVGVAAALAGVLSALVNLNFWPNTGDGYLLPTLAAVFVGGTPTWGGVGTIVGAIIGACTVGFIETGLIAAGFTGFFTQFFYGLVIILSLIGHRFNQDKYR
jgi:ribose/xylose/arabinose/galactoside ABC-type transport system permease subunit